MNGVTNVVGTLQCPIGCKNWRSGKICVVVRVQQPDKFHPIVCTQMCRKCKRNGVLDLDGDTYIERVSYRAMRLLGRVVAQPSEGYEKKTAPHDKEKCAACRAGIIHA